MKRLEPEKKTGEFVHLHVHSHMSMIDGAATIKDIIDEACRLKMPAIAITDHGNLFAAPEFYRYARHCGIKPIIGIEAYLTPYSHTDFRQKTPLFHLVLLARNKTGYMNLVKLTSTAFTKGFYYKPRIDFNLLEKHSEGLIALSSCIAGEVARKLLENDEESAVAAIKNYQRILGKGNFYVEIQNHGIPEQLKILGSLVKVARLCDAPIVATNDTHYIKSDDWLTQDLLMCVRTKSLFNDTHRLKFSSKEFYLKSSQEMKSIFCDFPDAIENTVKIAAMCNLTAVINGCESNALSEVTIRGDKSERFAVKLFLAKEHGLRKIANIIQFKHLAARSSIRAIGRILGVNAKVTGKIAKIVPAGSRKRLRECIKDVPELNKMFHKGTVLQKKILRFALKIDGFCLRTGVNPHRLLISSANIDELLPVMLDHRSNELVTQYESRELKELPFFPAKFQMLNIGKNLRLQSKNDDQNSKIDDD